MARGEWAIWKLALCKAPAFTLAPVELGRLARAAGATPAQLPLADNREHRHHHSHSPQCRPWLATTSTITSRSCSRTSSIGTNWCPTLAPSTWQSDVAAQARARFRGNAGKGLLRMARLRLALPKALRFLGANPDTPVQDHTCTATVEEVTPATRTLP